MIDRDEFLLHIGYIREDIQQVNARLDRMNGRVRGTESDIAILNDRTVNKALVWGGGSGAALVGIIEVVKALFKP